MTTLTLVSARRWTNPLASAGCNDMLPLPYPPSPRRRPAMPCHAMRELSDFPGIPLTDIDEAH